MMKCKDVVLKISSSHENESWKDRILIRFHLMMCKHCSRYSRQIDILGESVKKVLQGKLETTTDDRIKATEDEVIQQALRDVDKS